MSLLLLVLSYTQYTVQDAVTLKPDLPERHHDHDGLYTNLPNAILRPGKDNITKDRERTKTRNWSPQTPS